MPVAYRRGGVPVQPLLSACDLDEKEFDLLVQVASNLGWLAAYRKLRASEAVALGDSRFNDFQLPVGQHRNSSQASQRDLAISNLNRESQQLREVRAALRRITEGSFGVCEHAERIFIPSASPQYAGLLFVLSVKKC